MFERFTEEARRCLFFARLASAWQQVNEISPDDLLYGIVASAPDAAPWLTSNRNIPVPSLGERGMRPDETAEQWLERVEDESWFLDTSREIPFSPRVQSTLTTAMREADDLRDEAIRPEHILLALLREEGTEAWRTLTGAGVTLGEVRRVLEERAS
jgi:ATP-dependent Clp protease ATP-binding subunit ClpA